jgi:crotonobetainyl-CoA:carnitine CoA-transferase CaiB-like acyl-CoA transferase
MNEGMSQNRKEKPARSGPLSHLRVLDLTIFLSGPFATQMLGDLGAEVIKVEAPDGDMTRRLPPHFVGRESAYYLSINRNKSSLSLDLKTQRGRALLKSLALASDIVVENFRPGVLERLGLSYDEIAREKPSIVWCSISGFGQDGPYRDRPAYDMIVQAMSGGMSLTGEPEGRSVRSGIPIGDLASGMYASTGILAAVIEAQRTGRGKWVDIAMLDCQVAMLAYQAAYFLTSGQVPGRQGAGHDSIPTYRSFPCGDGRDVVITANTERMWKNLCGVLDLAHLADDVRFATNEMRYANRHELWLLLEKAFAKKPAAQWADELIAAEIPAAEVATLDRALTDPQVQHRNMTLELAGAEGETLRVAGNPLKYRDTPERVHAFPPHLGQDAQEILRDVLSLDDAEIKGLIEAGIVHADSGKKE